jgi:GxxExxY protein
MAGKRQASVSVFYFRRESDLILLCARRVQRLLGNCLTKEIYMDALELEFARAGLPARRNAPVSVCYGEEGEEPVVLPHPYTADFVVSDKIILAVRAGGDTGHAEDYALMTLLSAARMNLAILIQFKDKRVQTSRVCRYSRYLNSRNIGPEREEEPQEENGRDVVLTGTGVPD